MSRRAPRPLSDALQALQEQVAPAGTLARVQRVWEQAVGPGIAAEATPTAERDGVLTVTCTASVWAAELDMMAAELIGRINAALGSHGTISQLRCRTRRNS